jgi:hypothetical protein
MAKFVFAALAVTAIIWGTTAVASWHSGVTCRFVQNCTLSPIGEVLGDDA